MTWTQEQIDEKAKQLFENGMGFGFAWEGKSELDKQSWREHVIAAQMPIAPIADEEMYEVLQDTAYASISEQFVVAANKVIARRNAPPKPDLRSRAKGVIEAVLRGELTASEGTDGILAIVKEQQ